MENPDTHVIHIHGYHIAGQVYDCLRTFIYRTLRGGALLQVITITLNNECPTNTDIATSMNFILPKQSRKSGVIARQLLREKPKLINNKKGVTK